jgi:probable rRNA maturation factor
VPRSIDIANRHPRLRLNRREVRRVVDVLDQAFHLPTTAKARKHGLLSCPAGELSIVFLTDQALADLHRDFLDDPSTTDVITFEGDVAAGVAGEICVSADTAAAYAKTQDRDFASELTLYLVHGWLHLAGYDDLKPTKKRIMRRAEARAMTLLRVHHALPRFSWRR